MIIEVKDLHKSYGDIQAVKGISFSVEEGMLFSLLGTNGAGKSTTISVLTTVFEQTSGEAKVGGFDVIKEAQKVRELIGIVFQDSVLDAELSVYDNLMTRGSLYGYQGAQLKAKVDEVVAMTDLTELAKRAYKTLSGGQKRRADIARALVHRPKILFLDEPTTGLDPKTRKDIWQLIRSLQEKHGMTVLLTTHYMEEAAESDDILIIHQGEIKAHGTPEELKKNYCHDLLKLEFSDGSRLEQQLENTKEALAIIEEHKESIEHIEIISGTLDDVFLNLTRGLDAHVD